MSQSRVLVRIDERSVWEQICGRHIARRSTQLAVWQDLLGVFTLQANPGLPGLQAPVLLSQPDVLYLSE